MLELMDLGSDKVIGFRMRGKLEVEDFDKVAFAIAERLNRHDKVNLYAEIPSFDGISMEALLKDLQFGLRNWKHFKKEAVVTDKTWLRNAAEIAGKITPGIDVKAFPEADAEAAKQWVVEE